MTKSCSICGKCNVEFGVIFATVLIDINLRVPRDIKRESVGMIMRVIAIGTVTGTVIGNSDRFGSFIKAALDEVNQVYTVKMKDLFLVMNNALTHSSDDNM